MITVGIVQSEVAERSMVEHLLTSCYAGVLEKVYGADNGTDGISLAVAYKPDMILFDIELPNISGLDMAAVVNRLDPECEFIIISSYREFEYAQKAMHLGVSGYLLKPFDERQFSEILDKVIAKINFKRNMKKMEKSNEARSKQFTTYLDKQIIHDMITGEAIDSLNTPIYFEHLQLSERVYRCVVIRPLSMGQPMQRLLDETRDFLKGYGFSQIIGTIFSDAIVLLITAPNDMENIVVEAAFDSIVKSATERVERLIHETYIYAFSASGSALQFLSRSYYQAKKTIGVKRNIGTIRTELLRLHELETTLLERMLKLEKLKVYELLSRLLILVFDIDDETLRKDILKDFCFFIERNIWESIEGDDFARETSGAIRKIYEISEQARVRDAVNEFISECMMSIERRNADKLRGLIGNIKEYINENVGDSISLEGISQQFNISPSYLSRQFKKVERINLKDYIVKTRMELAKEYLIGSDRSVAEIAMLTGYTNANYFSLAFKKYEGVSPKKFAQTGKKAKQD